MRNGKYHGLPPEVEHRALRPTIPNGNPDVAPSSVGADVYDAGDPMGFEVVDAGDPAAFGATQIVPSPWSGWPADWATPRWNGSNRLEELVDVAWNALDLNASILSTMPAYLIRSGQITEPRSWLLNPDPDLYSCWEEFGKQLFWDFQTGEAFVLPTAYFSDGSPARFHVVEPWLVNVDMVGGRRRYNIGSIDVTDEILHIRYKSSTSDARGHGPLEVGYSRLIAAGLLARYASELVRGGGVPYYVIKSERRLTAKQSTELLAQWWDSRTRNLGLPAVLSGGVTVEALQFSPEDMALLDLSKHNESRISLMCGVPPHLLGLPSGGDPMTYSNVSSIFDYHWRAFLRPRTRPVMSSLSGWALPRGTGVELNADEYVREGFSERVTAWATLHGIQDETGRAVMAAQIAAAERLNGEQASAIMTGGVNA